jgi:hypothetical protein
MQSLLAQVSKRLLAQVSKRAPKQGHIDPRVLSSWPKLTKSATYSHKAKGAVVALIGFFIRALDATVIASDKIASV